MAFTPLRFPADLVSFYLPYSSQHLAKFQAGRILPAKTGNDNINKKAVINTAHTNKGTWCIPNPGARIFNIVVIKFIAPNIDDIPDMCKLNIAISTAADE